jgi:regulatory helix-turn-helix LysR family protein
LEHLTSEKCIEGNSNAFFESQGRRAHRLIEPLPLDWHIHQWDVMINHIDSMNEHVSLSGVDLNLLHVFDALMTERSVTRAGKQVGLSQSATSNALSRL